MMMNEQIDSTVIMADHIENALLIDWFSNILICPLGRDEIARYQNEIVLTFIKDLGENLQCQQVATAIIDELSQPDIDAIQRHLSHSYTLLFEGVSGPRSISLCESAYYGDGTRLFQKPFVEMQVIFQVLDVSIESDCKEPTDHISFELAAFAEALRQDRTDIIIALHHRLMRWVPQLVTDVERMQFASFYHNVLFLLDAYLTAFDR